MANAAICATNLADAGTWTASTAETLMPATNLQNEHVGKRWRSTAEPATITVDLGADTSIDVAALMGGTWGSTVSIQVLISTASGGAGSGDVLTQTYDASDPECDPDYGMLVVLLAAPASARYVRFVITDTPASYVEAGRGVVGLRETFTYNFVPGAGVTWTDRSRKTKSSGGQTLIFPDTKFRTAELNFDWVSEAQREALWDILGRVNGNSTDVLLILDTASDNLCRDSIFGLITDPVRTAFTGIADIYTAPLTVEERL